MAEPELHCIMPSVNLQSVLDRGILCNKAARRVSHLSVAMDEVQLLRSNKTIDGNPLHGYANLYFHARNPMLYKRRAVAHELVILRVSIKVLELAGVLVTDKNAACNDAKFYRYSEKALEKLPLDDIYADSWNHDDLDTKKLLGQRKCAEILVPNRVSPDMIEGCYVVNKKAKSEVEEINCDINIEVNGYMFFR